ncbi:hypothetical protein [Lihuaxuella thermophila]|uniref:Uncharacterized protein n=1 Tax=Lihuaxuella thermophila TaxID=1173111 RepID=A0A1H8ACJ2_9BACL|nr:hypothetical protein [Lihuaxuella thermophila]SEM68311.1 hypothetical protein SAMN05444955_10167 [Lihuaxuella thermophila]
MIKMDKDSIEINLNKKTQEDPPKKLYYIFPKDDPQSFIEFTTGRNDLHHIEDVDTHILVQLEEYEDEYSGKGEARFFSFDEREEMEEWIREREEKGVLRFEVQGGMLLFAWDFSDEVEEKQDWIPLLVIMFFLLSPVWFIAAVIFAYLYFF